MPTIPSIVSTITAISVLTIFGTSYVTIAIAFCILLASNAQKYNELHKELKEIQSIKQQQQHILNTLLNQPGKN